MLKIAVLAISILLPVLSFADENFGTVVNECLRNMTCLKTLKLAPNDCEISQDGIRCSPPIADKLFSNTRNCGLDVYYKSDQRLIAYLFPSEDKTKPCFIDGTSTEGAAYVNSDVATARQESNGSWKALRPVVAYNFAIPSSEMTVLRTNHPSSFPWNEDERYGCDEPSFPNAKCENSEEEPCKSKQEELRKKAGLAGHTDYFPERHVVGRTGAKIPPLITEFKLKKATKICSVLVPKDTSIRPNWDSEVCRAMTDGAIKLEFPLSVFPSLKSPNLPKTATVVCAPKATAKSQTHNVTNHDFKGIPKLDWQDCDCRVYENIPQ